MAKICTIRKQSDFKQMFASGKSYAGRYFVLYVRANECEGARFGFTAGKKIGNAVVRNRSKRLMKEVVRNNLDNIKGGFDYILVARSAGVDKGYTEFEEDFTMILHKQNLLRDTGKEDYE